MLAPKNVPAIKHRLLVILYLTCLTISLSPTIVAPPERTFVRGQPELHQAMDNLKFYEAMIKKHVDFPPGEIDGYPGLLYSKTAHLLSEAEHMLNRVKNVKERRWVEAFIHRMKFLSVALQKSIAPKHFKDDEKNNVSGMPLQATPLEKSNMTKPAAVQNTNSSADTNKVVSKYPVTSPEFNPVLPANNYSTEQPAITKPAPMPSKNSANDKLVLELESLHFLNQKKKMNFQAIKSSNAKSRGSASLLNLVAAKRVYDSEDEKERRNEQLSKEKYKKARRDVLLRQEIAQLNRRGESHDDTKKALHFDDLKFADFTNPNFAYDRKPNMGEEINKFEIAEDNLEDEEALKKMNELKNNVRDISRNPSFLWEPEEYESPPVIDLDPNETQFGHIQINLPQSTSEILSNHLNNDQKINTPVNVIRPHTRGIDNTIYNLQQPNRLSFILKNPMFAIPKDNIKEQRKKLFNGALKHKVEPNSHFPPFYYSQYHNRNTYSPYSYMHQRVLKNSTLLPSQEETPPLSPNSFPDHQINAQLSEEMNRQLRDGKIIVLSNSLVRSNFEHNDEKNATKGNANDKQEVKRDEPENVNTNDKENY